MLSNRVLPFLYRSRRQWEALLAWKQLRSFLRPRKLFLGIFALAAGLGLIIVIEQLGNHAAQAPHIDCLAVLLFEENDLGRSVPPGDYVR